MDDIIKMLAFALVLRLPALIKQLRLWHLGYLDRESRKEMIPFQPCINTRHPFQLVYYYKLGGKANMDTYTVIVILALVVLIPEIIRIIRIIHLKHLGIKYIGNGEYEKIGNKKNKWYEWLR